MAKGLAIAFACAYGICWSVTAWSADHDTSLQLCLHGAESQPDGCVTDTCRVEACERAAAEANPKALLLIGYAHVYGKGVPQDFVKAYMYFEALALVSEALGEREQHELKDYTGRLKMELEERMTPDEISRAKTMASAWVDEHWNGSRLDETR